MTTPHYLASESGVATLRRGGNAVEAAVAAAAVLSVVYPHMCGIGGDNFWLISGAGDGTVRALNGSGRSGAGCSIEWVRGRTDLEGIPPRGFLAANTVPGAVDGWGAAYDHAARAMGSRLLWSDLFEDAIAYAEDGFPVSPSQAAWTARNLDAADQRTRYLQRFEGFRRTYVKPDGTAYRAGEIFRQRELAATLRAIGHGGGRLFYEGDVARRIARYLQAHGGVLTAEDFASHASEWTAPLATSYRGFTAYAPPPNTQGFAALALLNILEAFDVAALGHGTADYLHVAVEATKLAFADRDRWLTDPAFVRIPLDRLLAKAYARERAGLLDMRRAAPGYPPGADEAHTVFVAAVDEARNVVAMIQSLYFDFGSGIVAGDTGVLLQNRGAFFSLDPGHVNRLEPRKRTFHTLVPAMLFRDGRPAMLYGTMGGEGQPQTQAALVTRVVDFGMDIQQAIEAPRWLYGRTWGAASTALHLEGRVPPPVVEELRRRGHPVTVGPDWADQMGHAQGIVLDQETGVLWGGADPRGDGAAIGW